MKLEVKPQRWMCLATSFAMVLGITTEEFCRLAGHDGSLIVDPSLPEPRGRRGFHIMEALLIVIRCGHIAQPFELYPVIRFADRADGSHEELQVQYHLPIQADVMPDLNRSIFESVIQTRSGVIECRTRSGNMHAVAFENGTIYDPDGRVFPYSRSACEARGLYTLRLWLVYPHHVQRSAS